MTTFDPRTQATAVPGPDPATVADRVLSRPLAIGNAYRTSVQVAERHALTALRIGLGLVYVWFGALKLADATPVADLVRHSLPFITGPVWMVGVLGVFEVLIGLWLMTGWRLALLLPVFVAHILGTLMVLVTEPGLTYQHGNPLLLTSTGEFVVKNLILLPAGIAICTLPARRAARR